MVANIMNHLQDQQYHIPEDCNPFSGHIFIIIEPNSFPFVVTWMFLLRYTVGAAAETK